MNAIPLKEINIPSRTLKKIAKNPVLSAEVAHLQYVSDSSEGISRKKFGKTFRYFFKGKRITDIKTLDRIRKLVIPPAWEKVWICPDEKGHLQATGIDTKNRKQYLYHALWSALRNETKYFRLYEFGKVLPSIRTQLEKDISLPGMPREKILALLVKIMERTTIRAGNSSYEKLYGSFGLTTLKNKHVNVKGSSIKFTFKGKKGVQHSITLRSKRLSRMVQMCLDIPGKELFQYYDSDGNRHSVDSGSLNAYIKRISESDFSSKDFRTWEGTLHALTSIKQIYSGDNEKSAKATTIEIYDRVAQHLGNTRTVCKKYYVHPLIMEIYEDGRIEKYLEEVFSEADQEVREELLPEEKTLLKILANESHTPKISAI